MTGGYLIDTNVISELRRREPEPRVVQWFERKPAGLLYMSVLSLGEIRRGVENLQASERQQALRAWLEEDLPAFFAGRLLPIDAAVAHRWGRLQAEMARPLPAIDSLLAATALEHRLVLITRNHKDLAGLPVLVANPWDP
ncbi:MAG: type II toxin-antitoxin system VapC family toxin [Cyanobium sp.]|jgi:predicted nucleic acid-binding protein